MLMFYLFSARLFLIFSLAEFSICCEIDSLYQTQIVHKEKMNFDFAKEINDFISFSKEIGPEIIPILMISLKKNRDKYRPMYQGVVDPFEPFIEGEAISQFKNSAVPYLVYEIRQTPSIEQKNKDYLFILNEIFFCSTHDIYEYVPGKIPWRSFDAKENVKNFFNENEFPKRNFPSSNCLIKCIKRNFN